MLEYRGAAPLTLPGREKDIKMNEQRSKIIPKNGGPIDLSGALLTLYGRAELGKSYTASLAPDALALDCAFGMVGKHVDRWPIATAADLQEALDWLRGPGGARYRTIILDGYDFLYNKTFSGKIAKGDDAREKAKQTQAELHPLIFRFVMEYPHLKLIVLNERRSEEFRTKAELDALKAKAAAAGTIYVPKVTIAPNVSPKSYELIWNASFLLARVEKADEAVESVLRVKYVDNPKTRLIAKTRTNAIQNGTKLADLWLQLRSVGTVSEDVTGRAAAPPLPEQVVAAGVQPDAVFIATNLTDLRLWVNLKTNDYYKSDPHLGNALKKITGTDTLPPSDDQSAWADLAALAIDHTKEKAGAAA